MRTMSLRIGGPDQSKRGYPCYPEEENSTIGNDDINWHLYKYRHPVENIFAKLTHFKAIATRYDKLIRHFIGIVALRCAFL